MTRRYESVEAQAEALQAVEAELGHLPRPATRGECPSSRPCPWVGCRHHLYLEVTSEGALKTAHVEPWEMEHSCSLDAAERGELTLEAIGELLGLSPRSVYRTEVEAMKKAKAIILNEGVPTEPKGPAPLRITQQQWAIRQCVIELRSEAPRRWPTLDQVCEHMGAKKASVGGSLYWADPRVVRVAEGDQVRVGRIYHLDYVIVDPKERRPRKVYSTDDVAKSWQLDDAGRELIEAIARGDMVEVARLSALAVRHPKRERAEREREGGISAVSA